VRIGIGAMLLSTALVALLPGLTGHRSLDGSINARFDIVSAPIEGTVLLTPPQVGTYVSVNEQLLTIRNPRVNRAVAASLSAEFEAARNRIRDLEEQRRRLAQLKSELGRRLRTYQAAMGGMLEQQIAISSKRGVMLEARQTASLSEFQRYETLEGRGILSVSAVEKARAAEAVTSAEVEVELLTLGRLKRQLRAVREGVFPGEGHNDAPYSRQRQDELAIHIADIDARLGENRTREAQIAKQLAEERRRVESLESTVIRAPMDGIVWRADVVAGSNVTVGNELIRILNCQRLFVDIVLAEAEFDEIYPRREVEVRLLGHDRLLHGNVMWVRGNAAVLDEDRLAASLPVIGGRNARIRLELHESHLNSDHGNFCHVGRSVQVRFPSGGLPLTRWVRSLWFSLL
jgi:multidrug resistance efflux pump